MARPMEERKKVVVQGQALEHKPVGFMEEQTLQTPTDRMAELTLLPRTMTMQLSTVVTQEQEQIDFLNHQLLKAGVSPANLIPRNVKTPVTIESGEEEGETRRMEYIPPTFTLRQSFYSHNRSIDGEHLEGARRLIESEINSQGESLEEPRTE